MELKTNQNMTPQQHQELIKSQIAASYNPLEKSQSTKDNNLEKGGAKVPIGTTHNGYKKSSRRKVAESIFSRNDEEATRRRENEIPYKRK